MTGAWELARGSWMQEQRSRPQRSSEEKKTLAQTMSWMRGVWCWLTRRTGQRRTNSGWIRGRQLQDGWRMSRSKAVKKIQERAASRRLGSWLWRNADGTCCRGVECWMAQARGRRFAGWLGCQDYWRIRFQALALTYLSSLDETNIFADPGYVSLCNSLMKP